MVKSVKARPSLSHTVAPSPRASTRARSAGRLYSPSDPPGKIARDRSAALVTGCSHAESVEARDVPAHDEGVDVVGAFVGVDRLQIHHVPDDRLLVDDARRAQDVAGHARRVEGHLDIVPLRQGELLGPRLALVLELAQAQAERLGLGGVRAHARAVLVRALARSDGPA